ncbi:hypothetical protein Agub_g6010, partial [Astrephomene gubernaculifera]
GSPALEAVPQLAALAQQALGGVGLGDPDGGLRALYGECVGWMAGWPARVWPCRAFAGMPRSIQDAVLHAAQSRLNPASAPGLLASCRQLASSLPPVAWAAHVGEMRGELERYGRSYVWSHWREVCREAGVRQDRSECWCALLEELRDHVMTHPDPDAAVQALVHWEAAKRALLYGGGKQAAVGAAAVGVYGTARNGGGRGVGGVGGGGGAGDWGWLGEEEAQHLQALYDHVRSYCVRHLPLLLRCPAFHALPPPQQQRIRDIAAQGVGTGTAAAARHVTTDSIAVQSASPFSTGRRRLPPSWEDGERPLRPSQLGGPPSTAGGRTGSSSAGAAAASFAFGGGGGGGDDGRSREGSAGGGAAWVIALGPEPTGMATPPPRPRPLASSSTSTSSAAASLRSMLQPSV